MPSLNRGAVSLRYGDMINYAYVICGQAEDVPSVLFLLTCYHALTSLRLNVESSSFSPYSFAIFLSRARPYRQASTLFIKHLKL